MKCGGVRAQGRGWVRPVALAQREWSFQHRGPILPGCAGEVNQQCRDWLLRRMFPLTTRSAKVDAGWSRMRVTWYGVAPFVVGGRAAAYLERQLAGGVVSGSGHSAVPPDTIPGREGRDGIERVNISAQFAHGIPDACGVRGCPPGDYVARVLSQEDAEMKPTWRLVWAIAVGVANPRIGAQGDRVPSPEPSVDKEPHDDD